MDQSTRVLARKLLAALNVPQSQKDLVTQAYEALPLLEAVGYYDLADFLRDNLLKAERQ